MITWREPGFPASSAYRSALRRAAAPVMVPPALPSLSSEVVYKIMRFASVQTAASMSRVSKEWFLAWKRQGRPLAYLLPGGYSLKELSLPSCSLSSPCSLAEQHLLAVAMDAAVGLAQTLTT